MMRRNGIRLLARAAGMVLLVATVAAQLLLPDASAQRAGDRAAGTARGIAPVDLTGYWVSVITEDWAWRMQTPPNGDYASVPLNDEGRRVADTWTEDQDGSCLAFGAAGLMRLPLRVRISWADDNTLRIETDNGRQTRLLHFGTDPMPDRAPSRQGVSTARWQVASRVTGRGATAGILTTDLDQGRWGSLEVVTTNLTPGWLRRNGVPYSAGTVVTEYFDRFTDGDDDWFTVTTVVTDPTYLTEPFVTSSNFKRERDGSKFDPRDCRPAG